MKTQYRAMTTRGRVFIARTWWECVIGVTDIYLRVQPSNIRILSRDARSWYLYSNENEFRDDLSNARRTLWVAVIVMEEIK